MIFQTVFPPGIRKPRHTCPKGALSRGWGGDSSVVSL